MSSENFSFIPTGFFQGLALQLPFKRRNSEKVNKTFSSVLNSDSTFESDTNLENIELVQFSHQVVVDQGDESGVGHDFSSVQLKNPTWCDRCGDFIWGLTKNSTKCQNCNYTCHERCKHLVTLDCKGIGEPKVQNMSQDQQNDSIDDSKCNESDCDTYRNIDTTDTSMDNLEANEEQKLIEKLEFFNEYHSSGLRMKMNEDGKTFRGFIRVHMNLCRPINVVAGTRPPSIYDIIYDEEESARKTLTSFYLPRDTVKALHVTSTTTTHHVIIELLKKFKVVDNPRKFALYECYNDPETKLSKMRCLQDLEKPLLMALNWGTNGIENRSFVLQENDTGDILWDAFSTPELNNFLRILDIEEAEYLNQVRIKYKAMQEKLEELMTQSKP